MCWLTPVPPRGGLAEHMGEGDINGGVVWGSALREPRNQVPTDSVAVEGGSAVIKSDGEAGAALSDFLGTPRECQPSTILNWTDLEPHLWHGRRCRTSLSTESQWTTNRPAQVVDKSRACVVCLTYGKPGSRCMQDAWRGCGSLPPWH